MATRFAFNRRQPRPLPYQGFTLVEILVVVALVSFLSALLLSAFSRVRSASRTVTCAANLRQIGMAGAMYANDNRGFYPSVFSIKEPNCDWAELLFPYIKSAEVFKCPSFPNGEYRTGCPVSDTSEGFSLNQAFDWDGSYSTVQLTQGAPINQVRLRHPSSTVLYLDGNGKTTLRDIRRTNIVINGEPISEEQLLDFSELGNRHNYGANLCFADGHVKWLSFSAMRDPSLWRAD